MTNVLRCPTCTGELDITNNSGIPDAGDITLCLGCAALLTFDEELHPRLLNDEEMGIIRKNSQLSAQVDEITSSIRQVKRMRAARQN